MTSVSTSTPRRRKAPEYRRWRFQKRIKHPGPRLSSSLALFRRSLGTLWRHKKLFGGMLLVYVILSLILVRGFDSATNLSATKATLSSGHASSLESSASLLSGLFVSSSSSSAGAAAYQSVLFLIVSLAIIWSLRQIHHGANSKKEDEKITLKAAFYQSTGPFTPFVLVSGVILLQLLPLLFGMGIYSAMVSNGLVASPLEQILWITILLLFSAWSFYMLSSSIFALYVVTLPGTPPMKALKSAKKLVKYRRWTVVRKILALPLILFIATCLVMLPIVLILTGIAQWLFFVWGLGLVIVSHAYLYNLYRELL